MEGFHLVVVAAAASELEAIQIRPSCALESAPRSQCDFMDQQSISQSFNKSYLQPGDLDTFSRAR